MATVAAKRPSVPADKFLEAYVRGVKEKKTAKQVAEELGMNEESFGVRASQLRAKFRKPVSEGGRGKVLPPLAGGKVGGGRKVDYDKLESIAADILGELDDVTDEAEAETPDQPGDVKVGDEAEAE